MSEWLDRLRREAIRTGLDDHDLLYHVSLRPAFPEDYDVAGMVAITFRLRPRPQGGHLYVTSIDPAAATRLGERFGLDAAGSIAMVDSHERIHVVLQLEGVHEEHEEAHAQIVDHAWLDVQDER